MEGVKTFDGLAIRARRLRPRGLDAPSRVERGRWLYDQIELAMAANPGGVLMLQVVLETASAPDGPMREENNMRLRRWGRSLRRIVTVPSGSLLWANLVRTIMRAMFLLSGQSGTQLVTRTAREGFDALLKEATPRTPPRKTLEAGLKALFDALGVQQAPSAVP